MQSSSQVVTSEEIPVSEGTQGADVEVAAIAADEHSDVLTLLRYLACIADQDEESPRFVAPGDAALQVVESRVRRRDSTIWTALRKLLVFAEREWKRSVQRGKLSEGYETARHSLWRLMLGGCLLRPPNDFPKRRFGLELKALEKTCIAVGSFSCLPGGMPFLFGIESDTSGGLQLRRGRPSLAFRPAGIGCEGILEGYEREELVQLDRQLGAHMICSWIRWLRERCRSQTPSKFRNALCATTVIHLKYFTWKESEEKGMKFGEALRLWQRAFLWEKPDNTAIVSLLRKRLGEWESAVGAESLRLLGTPPWEEIVTSTISFVRCNGTFDHRLMESASKTFPASRGADPNRGFAGSLACKEVSFADVAGSATPRWSSYEMHFVCIVGSALGAWNGMEKEAHGGIGRMGGNTPWRRTQPRS